MFVLNALAKNIIPYLEKPFFKGSYSTEDCVFVLKDIESLLQEEKTETRERKMTKGVHYSEMLPIEELPSEEYMNLFHQSLKETAPLMAQYVSDVSEMILKDKGEDVILLSLARAGTPIGVLIKRYLKWKYNIDAPHYSVSIIRGKGIDENALLYIMNKHKSENVQFIDGWTGKGMIGKVLEEAISSFNDKFEVNLSNDLAVLADPAHSAQIYGTRDDYFLPSSCLNSIVSGLASRTVHRSDLIGEYDFHGAKYYHQWEKNDVSLVLIEEVVKHFPSTIYNSPRSKEANVSHKGWTEMENVQKEYGIASMNSIKPGIGETTRVLLRRVPWKVLVKDKNDPKLKHVYILAKEKGVEVIEYPNMSYSCIGLIKEGE